MNLNYGLIGNSCTAALISDRGNIDWLCMPYFDSPSIFASLLDKDKGGRFGIEVGEGYEIAQKYIPHTNLLRTHFKSAEGEFEITDFMPYYTVQGTNEYYHPSEVYRYFHFIQGSPRIRIEYKPKPDYARGKCMIRVEDNHIESLSDTNDKDRQYLYSSLPLNNILQGEFFTLQKDEFFLLSYNEKIGTVDMDKEKLEYCRTLVFWLNWSETNLKFSAYSQVIERSLLTLKMMQFYNGAVLAAITTSLPEVRGDVRNWDYRFCWLRDASMTIETLVKCGHTKAARRFVKFVESTFTGNHSHFQIMYGIHGERRLTEKTLDHLSGYDGSKPVRIGNKAYLQKQNDSFGYLMNMIYQYYTLVPGSTDDVENMWDMVKSIEEMVIRDWRKPDKGIWEIRGKARHFLSSKVMCWVALDRGAKIARQLGKTTFEQRWNEEAETVKSDVLLNGWKENLHTFTQTYDNNYLDSSVLLMEAYGFISADDPKYRSTVQVIEKNLFKDGLMYRYNSPDDFGQPQSAFVICTFWLIRALFVTGEKDKAGKLFESILSRTNHLGMLSEDISFETGELLGNFPQAYSHLALINTARLFSD
ncbi:glycoside hydrolase family 15 protein [Prevotella cerevisiae]|uniref:Glycoside hydrolase family 15 protein n=1 Tax=Segatella cerevisiae TaxID=2053716 RepID=A0ABT1BX34_9BACT|nr:glycoside hydrolase family 15 protein [Segatella cerevisiae]MCO6025635.1 glycoside hydrolase family 15 protein [Segatella cerevisiae]